MRIAVLAVALLLTACGTTIGAAASGRPSPTASTPSPTARVTSPTTRDCTVSWVDHFTTLTQLVAKADTIVRAVAVSQDIAQLTPGLGAQPTRDARRTTFRVIETLKGGVNGQLRVLEDVCPNLDVRAGDEWLLFVYRWDPLGYGPSDGGDYFMARGGPQGQFRSTGGKISGPFFTFAPVVHSYEGASIEEVIADTRAALR